MLLKCDIMSGIKLKLLHFNYLRMSIRNLSIFESCCLFLNLGGVVCIPGVNSLKFSLMKSLIIIVTLKLVLMMIKSVLIFAFVSVLLYILGVVGFVVLTFVLCSLYGAPSASGLWRSSLPLWVRLCGLLAYVFCIPFDKISSLIEARFWSSKSQCVPVDPPGLDEFLSFQFGISPDSSSSGDKE